MKTPAIAKDKALAIRRWIFRWKGLDGTPFPTLLAVAIAAGTFSLFAATVKIHVSAPQQWVERKASIMHLSSDGDGQLWALRAREGGPFPARLDASFWENSPAAASELGGATRLSPEPYQPKLRDLPAAEDSIPAPVIAAKGERVFPIRTQPAAAEISTAPTRMMPELYPLSGILLAELPAELPAFELPVDAALAAGSWRFLLRLRPDGGVAECVTLSEEPGGNALARWLRGVTFRPETAKKSEWISLGVFFTNQAVHGPDAR